MIKEDIDGQKIYERILSLSEIQYGLLIFNDECKPFLPKIDGKYILALKCKDANRSNLEKRKCERCGELVCIPSTFKNENIDGAICRQCANIKDIPHITVVDKKDKNIIINSQINITTWGIYRLYGLRPFIKKYNARSGDIINFYFNTGNSNEVQIEYIKSEYKKKEQISCRTDTDTITIICSSCGLIYKLSDKDTEEAVNFITNNKLSGIDILNYMNIKKGRTCDNKNHIFEIEHIFYDTLSETINKYNDATSKYSVYKREIEEINIKKKTISEKLLEVDNTMQNIKEYAFQLTRISDMKLLQDLIKKEM